MRDTHILPINDLRTAVLYLLEVIELGEWSCRDLEPYKFEAILEDAVRRGKQALASNKTPAAHAYKPDQQWPWFCSECGYPEHERLQHEDPTMGRNDEDIRCWSIGRELAGMVEPMADEIPPDILVSVGHTAIKLAAPNWEPIETAPKDGRWFVALPADIEQLRVLAPSVVRVMGESRGWDGPTDDWDVECVAITAGDRQRLSLFTHWLRLPPSPCDTDARPKADDAKQGVTREQPGPSEEKASPTSLSPSSGDSHE